MSDITGGKHVAIVMNANYYLYDEHYRLIGTEGYHNLASAKVDQNIFPNSHIYDNRYGAFID
jgi:hypothetical protein